MTQITSQSSRRLFSICFWLLTATLATYLLSLLHMGILSLYNTDAAVRNSLLLRTSVNEKYFNGYVVNTPGSLLERLVQFNKAMSTVRRLVLEQNRRWTSIKAKPYENGTVPWDASVLNGTSTFLWGGNDDYEKVLAAHHQHIITVVLPWKNIEPARASSQGNEENRIIPSTDRSNVLEQTYYQWTGDDQLCKTIERAVPNKFRYDTMFNRSCSRDIGTAATKQVPLPWHYFCNKIISRNHYWPNNGNTYPEKLFSGPPPAVFYTHIHQDAVVNKLGDVASGNTALAEIGCRNFLKPITYTLPKNARTAPLYEEVLSLGQEYASAVYHLAVEVVPRMAPLIGFLKVNPQIRIQAGEGKQQRIGELFQLFGLNKSRLISGAFRAKLVYQPKGLGCAIPSVQEVQLTAKLYRDYIAKTVDLAQPRQRLILIQRIKSRRFKQHDAIAAALKLVAAEFKLTFTLFSEKKLPSLRETMALFNAAVMVVGPHGAGFSNIIFSQPGTFVVEGVSNTPHMVLCFQRLAHILGHRYHGLASKEGFPRHVNVPVGAVVKAVKQLLNIWKQQSLQQVPAIKL